MSQSKILIDSAWSKVGNDSVLRNRLGEISEQLLYLHVIRHVAEAKIDGREKMLIDYLRSRKCNYREGCDYKVLQQILNNKSLSFLCLFIFGLIW